MELILQNMTPPSSCSTCFLNRGEKRPEYGLSIFCPYSHGVIKDEKYIYGGKLDSCGILPIADHGRLIDADAVTLKDGPYEYDEWCEWALRQYQAAPTIIPAEEGEE